MPSAAQQSPSDTSSDDALEAKRSLSCHTAGCLKIGSIPQSSTITLTNSLPDPTVTLFPPCETTDGGVRAWLSVLGASLALFATFGLMNAFGTFQAWYSSHQLQHLPPSTISWIGSLQLWMFFFAGGPVGRLYDSYGPTALMIIGTILYLFSLMMTSISTQFYQYVLCQGIVFGLGVGMLFYPCMASVSTHFLKLRATALGIAAAGSSLGGVVYPILLRQLFDKVGFGWAVRIAGFIGAACCVVAVLTVNSRVPPTRPKATAFNFAGFNDLQFILLTAGGCFVALGLFIPFFYLAEFAHAIGISTHLSFYVLAVLNGGGVLGRIAPAYLSDALGRFNLLAPSAFLAGLSCVSIWLFTHEIIALMFFAAVYGFFSGAFISLITPCVAQISEMNEIGTRIGTLYTVISFPSLLGGPIGGFLLTRGRGSYVPMATFAGSAIIIGSFLILWSKLRINTNFLARV
ncbi:hypothetical protein PC9H_010405 [Pleurotus ostreatus]|uniref:Major facilitator superfamily (MFS) profile domain-containing protein n=1 Tax=Pleurotus ostreatus TaxID=5322 RepID=A0A8H7DNM0_PLEOS|nr:uncharacterized protein PC9H_010405 [Pleurotus ostreatus]KAF7422249.1 hypothetical protein PC9H_010405 [Pleurotus ostreatus]KAJ8691952.1 hypothetical protein PTI98_011468 [Pleurotus ostreatus]